MAAYLICLTTSGGVPLFCRSRGGLHPLPFPLIGSLNGVHMFAESQGVKLVSSSTETSKFVWRVYHDSITLILVTQNDALSDQFANQLLDLLFHSMVLLYGLDDLTNIKNIERFKKEIRVCHAMMDWLLEQVDSPSFSALTGAVDIMVGSENQILQSYVEAFSEAANSPYGCLLIGGKVTVATKKWWELSQTELVLLSALVCSCDWSSMRDIPIFLPTTSPTVPHRLLTFQLINHVEVCVICGPSPTMDELEREVLRFWKSALDSLRTNVQLKTTNYSQFNQLDKNIMGLLLVNTKSHQCLSCFRPDSDIGKREGEVISMQERSQCLKQFYKTVKGNYFMSSNQTDENTDGFQVGQMVHDVKDIFTCSATHKCYATRKDSLIFCILFHPSIPTYAMRSTTKKTLGTFLRDKTVLI